MNLEEQIDRAVAGAVEKYVNGYMRSFNSKLDDHIESTNHFRTEMYAFMDRMKAAEDITTWFTLSRKGLQFIGITGAAVFTALWLYLKDR